MLAGISVSSWYLSDMMLKSRKSCLYVCHSI